MIAFDIMAILFWLVAFFFIIVSMIRIKHADRRLKNRKAMQAAFNATPKQLGEAAVSYCKRTS